jgi:hypothetical protein
MMAHELDMKADGTASMAYVQDEGLPWHGLGVAVSNDLTAQEMMFAAGLIGESQSCLHSLKSMVSASKQA